MQLNVQPLPTHAAELFGTAVHTCPQLPQSFTSVVVSSHSVGLATGHAVSPALQVRPQWPVVHVACPPPLVGAGQVFEHPPQLFGSPCSSTHSAGDAVGQGL